MVTFTLPDPPVDGQPGHIADHTAIRNALSTLNGHGHAASEVSDSTATGQSLMTAANAAAVRAAAGLGTAAVLNVPAAGDAAAGEVVKGSDTRLTDARTPTSHSHASTDVSDSTATGRSVLTAADAAAARTAIGAGTSSFDGAYSSLTGKPTLGTAAALNVPATGDAAAGEVVKGSDSRLTDARTPSAHASSHADGGGDELDVSDLASGSATSGQLPAADGAGGVAWGNRPTAALVFSVPGAVAVATGAARVYNPTGASLTLLTARASVGTAPTGANLIAVIKKNGSTTVETLTITAGSNATSRTTLSASLADGDYLTVDVTQVGSTVAGSDLTVQIEF